MSALYAGVLGIVQGLAEFLPISSSAHLILARVIFGWESDAFGLPFDVACHMGTLAAVFMYFRRDLIAMALSLRQPFADTRAAGLKEGLDVSATGINSEATQLFAIGLITSAIVGYLTIKYFIRYVAHHRLTIFAYYRLIVAALVLVWLAVKAQ